MTDIICILAMDLQFKLSKYVIRDIISSVKPLILFRMDYQQWIYLTGFLPSHNM